MPGADKTILQIQPGDEGKFKWERYMKLPRVVIATQIKEPFMVLTEHGWAKGSAGDFVVSGVDGELYPISEKHFEETFEWINGASRY